MRDEKLNDLDLELNSPEKFFIGAKTSGLTRENLDKLDKFGISNMG